jgi:hypothetical protein
VEYLPSLAGYISDRYNPTKQEILIAPARGLNVEVYKQFRYYHNSYLSQKSSYFNHSDSKMMKQFVKIRDLYPQFKYSELASHPAIVILPYQVSFMSFFEYYRMGIPMYIPSIHLLTEWHMKYNILNEKSWNSVFGNSKLDKSTISKHHHSTSRMKYDPNNELSKEALLEWLPLSDFYTFPNITTFDSWNQLFHVTTSVTLSEYQMISKAMLSYLQALETEILNKWEKIVTTVTLHSKRNEISNHKNSISNKSFSKEQELKSLNEALFLSYGIRLSDSCTGEI